MSKYKEWPSDEVVNVPIDSIFPNPRNPRTHSSKQVGQIAAAIKEWGFTTAILVDEENQIIAGHGRYEAAKKLKLNEVPVMVAKGWSDTKKRAYVIADNKLALNSEWDEELLNLELAGLKDEGFDIDLTGFDDFELEEIEFDEGLEELEEIEFDEGLEEPDDIDQDDIKEPVTKLGDVWLLGDHRLMCGDSTSESDISKLMNGAKADFVFTDPPYNTGMTAKTQEGVGGTLWKGNKKPNEKAQPSHMFDDDFSDEDWQAFMSDFCSSIDQAAKDDSFIFVCLDWRRSFELVPHLKNRWKLSNVIVWDKIVHGLGSDYKYTYELIHVCKKGKPPLAKNKDGDREYQDIWRIQRKMGKDKDHATKKPIEICERSIKHCSNKGDNVLDIFCGSGSTLLACENLKRLCFTIELMNNYCDVTIRRWQEMTGKQAVLESTGETYDSLKEAI